MAVIGAVMISGLRCEGQVTTIRAGEKTMAVWVSNPELGWHARFPPVPFLTVVPWPAVLPGRDDWQ